ncbi:MAG: NAD(P)H-dependent glycerol-3-phosphate dehydrogenase [Candidatus Thiothrix putei]|uniref:Glycerol-3-phosphate dehydrogenase [NAD(P)+] n=1 Tax=Candidatus Thiothrix putei TaxID=3080811 RepID=A0AA95HC39_9GAMM|nr:MAG: NAD(P)H-dependent glycerol-3-phosphate dehydrogenase [Candidatus Thiothrix putei]
MSERIQSIAVYGAGSWGTALALQLARNGLNVLLWDINSEHVANLNRQRENAHYLPGIPFPDKLHCSDDLPTVAAFADYHLVVVPSHVFREMLRKLAPLLNADAAVLWATKGLELETGKLLHQVLEEELPQCRAYGVVSGPTFAAEVARGLPTAMTVAANQSTLAQAVAAAFSAANYRAYISNDVLGVELGGAVKNVLAIAAGISDGLGFGANARVAIVTRGLAEIMRLGAKLGAQPETLMGLAGVGDLVLTCTDNQSRNRRLGLALGQGKSRDAAIAEIGQAVEGAKSALSIGKLAERAGVEMPICQQVYRILYEHLPPKQAVNELLSRDLKAEF